MAPVGVIERFMVPTRYLAMALAGIVLSGGLPAAVQEQPARRQYSEDTLRPGDIVELTVWREPDFTGEFFVDENGIVVLPRLGPVDVLGRSPAELEVHIRTGYEQYLRNPSIEVTFLRRITVFGAVQEAGLYPVDPTMTISDALALAGGARPDGKLREIQLLRDGEVLTRKLTAGTRIGDLPIRSGDQLFIPDRSWLERNATVFIGGLISAVTSIAVALIFTR